MNLYFNIQSVLTPEGNHPGGIVRLQYKVTGGYTCNHDYIIKKRISRSEGPEHECDVARGKQGYDLMCF